MGINIAENILSVCKVLNKHSVQYLIVGGTAVALHGYFRKSVNVEGVESEIPDLDFWYNPTYENYFKLLDALNDLGQDITEFKKEKAPNPQSSYFRYQFQFFTLDFLPELKATLTFRLSYEKREVITLNGVDIHFIDYEDLITDKQANFRPKDIHDIEQLEFLRKQRDK
jgi:hypothetical protein